LVTTSLSKELVTQKAIQHMAAKDYNLISQTDDMLVFEDGKNISTGWLILGIFLLLIGAIIYYIMAKRHTITVTLTGIDDGTRVLCATNTTKSMMESNLFLASLQ